MKMQTRRASSPETWPASANDPSQPPTVGSVAVSYLFSSSSQQQQLAIKRKSSSSAIRPNNNKDKRRQSAWIIENDNIISASRPHYDDQVLLMQQSQNTTDVTGPNSAIGTMKSSFWTDIGIVGFITILDSHASKARRIIWFIVLTTCFGLMVAQTWERLSYYMTEPVSTSVRYIRNDSLLFPSVVLCPYRQTLENDTAHLDPLKLRRMFDEDQHEDREPFKDSLNAMYHLVNHYDVRTLWATTGWDLESQISTCLRGRVDCKREAEKVFTVLGSCLHYPASEVSISGQFYGLDIRLCPHRKEEAQIGAERRLLQEFYLMISNRHSTYDIRSLTHGFYLKTGWQKDISLSLKEFHSEKKKRTLSSSSNDVDSIKAVCTSDKTKTVSRCISLCFHRALVDKINCRMPYMNLFELDSVPYCNTSQQLLLADKFQQDLLWKGQGWHPGSSCRCDLQPVSCSQSVYETSTDSFSDADRPQCARYKIFFTDMTYEETKEEFSYDIVSLLCDIGGTFGLLLGASLLTVVQIIDSFSRQITDSYTTSKLRNKKNSNKVTAGAAASQQRPTAARSVYFHASSGGHDHRQWSSSDK